MKKKRFYEILQEHYETYGEEEGPQILENDDEVEDNLVHTQTNEELENVPKNYDPLFPVDLSVTYIDSNTIPLMIHAIQHLTHITTITLWNTQRPIDECTILPDSELQLLMDCLHDRPFIYSLSIYNIRLQTMNIYYYAQKTYLSTISIKREQIIEYIADIEDTTENEPYKREPPIGRGIESENDYKISGGVYQCFNDNDVKNILSYPFKDYIRTLNVHYVNDETVPHILDAIRGLPYVTKISLKGQHNDPYTLTDDQIEELTDILRYRSHIRTLHMYDIKVNRPFVQSCYINLFTDTYLTHAAIGYNFIIMPILRERELRLKSRSKSAMKR